MSSTTARPDKTVLVVEDDPWIRSLMADLLAGEGYAVVQASDGKAGLELAEQNEPDVILLDLAMPEKSGLDVLHELKSSKPTRDIPVIVVSAYAMLMMGSDARRADGVIQKPFDLADLLAGEGYTVVQASDGKAGLDLAEQNDPDVILLDLAMPEKSGLDVLHELKSSKPTRDIPVIVVSAYAMLMMGSDARRADGVIQKPFDLADLLMQVEQAAGKRHQTA